MTRPRSADVLATAVPERMLRAFRSLRVLRRFLTAFVALALSGGVLEAALPDVHDGDAGLSSVESHAAAREAHSEGGDADTGAAESERAQVTGTASDDERSSSNGTQHLPGQTAHAEHCGHAHVATTSLAPELGLARACFGDAPTARVATLLSVASVPVLRPPIA